jgi:hypothetical protein
LLLKNKLKAALIRLLLTNYTYMEPFKPRTKILLMVEASKITFSGNKGDAQIATLAMAQR